MTIRKKSPLRRIAGAIAKTVLWSAMALFLLVAGTVICCVKVLEPRHLTPIAERVASRYVNADISIGCLTLDFKPHFPLLHLGVDRLAIVSHSLDGISDSLRATLPADADTLLTIDSFNGGLNVGALLRQRLELTDVEFDNPRANIVIAAEGANNFDIFRMEPSPEDTVATEPMSLPLSINRFWVRAPRLVRYYNATDGTDATLALDAAELNAGIHPSYTLSLEGSVDSPLLNTLINLQRIALAMDGRIIWDPKIPNTVSLDGFTARAAGIGATFSTTVNLGPDLIVNRCDFKLLPVPVDTLLTFLSDSLRQEMNIGRGKFSCTSSLSANGSLTRPLDLSRDSIPYARISATLSPGKVIMPRARELNIQCGLDVELRGNDLDSAVVTIGHAAVSGPATSLGLKGSATTLLSDPAFDISLGADCRLAHLPGIVRDMARGAIDGRIKASLDVTAKASMFSAAQFHRIKASGTLTANDLFYFSADTTNMAYVNSLRVDLGTDNRAADNPRDRMLSARLTVDSIDFLHSIYSVRATGLTLGAGMLNDGSIDLSDTTRVIPMGGKLGIGRMTFNVLTDSAGFVLKGLDGQVTMKRHKGRERTPEFGLNVVASRLSAGDPTSRIMIRNAGIVFNAYKKDASRRQKKARERIKRTADSISTANPEIPLDSVYILAMEKHRRNHVPGKPPRVHPELTADDLEIIDWGTSDFLRKFLTDWKISGSVTSQRGSLFTAYFPLRNRLRHLDIQFNNDSLHFTDLQYKAGRSDILISGNISNLRRAFTSRGFRQPLRINLSMRSDTIDINQLSATAYRGAGYAGGLTGGTIAPGLDEMSDSDFDAYLSSLDSTRTDSIRPILIPTNIEADINLRASTVLYSDLTMNRLRGNILVYDGAANLHRLSARSDAGAINLSALYSAPSPRDMKFGFGMTVNDFNIQRFLNLVPAVDSIMPLLRDFGGIIDADIAATADVDSAMNLVLPTLQAAVKLHGDSLRLVDDETFKTIGKWLLFKNKNRNIIDHMTVEMIVKDNQLEVFPFIFDFDRYRLGVQGYNDLAMNFDYHISVLKSPLPFKFGVTVKGDPDHYKVRVGKSRFNEKTAAERVPLVDTTRVNLINQLENVFRRGVRQSRFATLDIGNPRSAATINLDTDTLSRADSLLLIQEGLIPAPPVQTPEEPSAKRKKRRK